MPRITNPNYDRFLKEGYIQTIEPDDLGKGLDKIQGKYQHQARALIIILYYTGARPNEVVRMTGKHVMKRGNRLILILPGSKRGHSRQFPLSMSRKFVKEVYDYARSMPPDMLLFHHYGLTYHRQYKKKSGEVVVRQEMGGNLRYVFRKCFDDVIPGGINPYYLRHNRMTKWMEEDLSPNKALLARGGKSYDTLMRYAHASKKFQDDIVRRTK